MTEQPYGSSGVGSDEGLPRTERVKLLQEEMKRISDPYHKAIDNYYKVVPLAISIVAAVASVAGKLGGEKFLALVPFLCLAIALVESQIRTTIMCASKYLALMELRINAVAGFQALLYEHRLSLGNSVYYSHGGTAKYRRMRFSSFFIFFFVLFLVFAGSLANFLHEVLQPDRPQLFFMPTQLAVVIYLLGLGLCTGVTAWSWFGLFRFADKVYPTMLEEQFLNQVTPVESSREFSAKLHQAMGVETSAPKALQPDDAASGGNSSI